MITFTRDWNGYPAGASVGTLAATTEAAAVAAGAAVYGGTSYPLRTGLDRYGNAISLVDGAGNQVLRLTETQMARALFAPGDGQTLTTTMGAGATLDASGTETIDGEEWRWYTITGISGSANYLEVNVPTFAALSADSAMLHWRSSVVNSGISATVYLGTASYATSATSSGGAMASASATVYRGHSGTIGAPSAWTELTKNSYTRDTSEQLWTVAKVRFVVPNASTTTIRVRALYAGFRRRKGRIFIIADDGAASFHDLGVQILARYGLKSTSGIIADRVGATSYFTTERQLRDYVAAGNLCVAHGPVGGSGNLFSVNATDAAAVADMQANRDWLLSRGLTNNQGAQCYIWPQGQWTRTAGDPAFLDLAWTAGFRVARLSDVQTKRFVNAPRVVAGKHNLLGTSFGHRYEGAANTADDAAETININAVITRAQFVAASGLDSYLVLHEVVGRGAASTTIQIEADRLHTLGAALQTLVAAGTLECPTMDEMVPSA
jgi:hypothetical protein